MATPVKRPGAPAPAAVENRVNFGDMAFYTSGGGQIPEGNYILYFDSVVHQFEKQTGEKAGPEFLAVRASAYEFDNPTAEPRLAYYSMGRKAIESFLPNPDDEGKSLVAVPNGPAKSLNEMSNWAIFLKSLYNSSMPEGVFTNDLRTIDGVWVHISNIPEPEQRKQMGSNLTGDGQSGPRKSQEIAVVSEILEGGAPWEGGGGMPEEKPKAKVAGKIAPKAPTAPTRPAPKPQPKPAAVVEEATDDDLAAAAMVVAGKIIEASPEGIAKTLLRVNLFKDATKTHGQEMAQKILDTYFTNEEATNTFLAELGYTLNGPRVVPIA